ASLGGWSLLPHPSPPHNAPCCRSQTVSHLGRRAARYCPPVSKPSGRYSPATIRRRLTSLAPPGVGGGRGAASRPATRRLRVPSGQIRRMLWPIPHPLRKPGTQWWSADPSPGVPVGFLVGSPRTSLALAPRRQGGPMRFARLAALATFTLAFFATPLAVEA